MPREAPLTAEVEERVWKLLQIGLNIHNWSWLLNPYRPLVPPDVPLAKKEAGFASVVRTTMEDGAEVSCFALEGESFKARTQTSV